MSNATAVAPVRATKAPARAKAAPSSELLQTAQTGQHSTTSERTVASTGAALLGQAVSMSHDDGDGVFAASLLELGQQILLQLSLGEKSVGTPQEVFYFAASTCKGALAIEQQEHASSADLAQLLNTAFDLLNNAGLAYDCTMHPCAEAAAAIEAGARQFRDRPAPPIRRIESDTDTLGDLTRQQLIAVLEVTAGDLATINQILMQAQTEQEPFCAAVLIDAAQSLVRHCGGMADTAAGEAILGGHDRWNFGPNFADLGKAGAA